MEVISGKDSFTNYMLNKTNAYILFCLWVYYVHPEWDNETAGRYWDNQNWRFQYSKHINNCMKEILDGSILLRS